MKKERVRKINQKPVLVGPVVYWMNREIRTRDNWALLYAQELALKQRVPLLVVYNAVAGYLGAGYRQWSFEIEGLREVSEALTEKNIPFFLLVTHAQDEGEGELVSFFEKMKPGVVVTDFVPLRAQFERVRVVNMSLSCSFQMVDAHNIVPVWLASSKQEYGARTLRPKLYALLPEYLESFPLLKKHPHNFVSSVPAIDWKQVLTSTKMPIEGHLLLHSGEKAALKSMTRFITTRLETYALMRNDALAEGQSGLSPYFHFGMIAPQRVALEVQEYVGQPIERMLHNVQNRAKENKKGPQGLIDHAGAFLEELIIRRELSDNFCFYNKNYDRVEGFPDWARKSLDRTRNDVREYVYTQKVFEHAETHDELWNAAQNELLISGKIHGYMRMYWAKKILEWTKTPEEALQIALFLNDTYELDGRDPNGYAGIAWSIGGAHDRSWFSRPIFGSIRYMARSGAEKKFDVRRYIEKWNT